MTTVLLVEKLGNLKPLKIKDFQEADFYKKCGYKSPANFQKQHTWKVRIQGTTYFVDLFAKRDVNHSIGENKYEFPPPVDSVLFFGTCLLTAYTKPLGRLSEPPDRVCLTVDLWKQMYDKLYGGFENLADTAETDANEIDELENVPKHKKTKEGYLKDGFVVETKANKLASSTSTSGAGGGGGAPLAKAKKNKTKAKSSNATQPSVTNTASLATSNTSAKATLFEASSDDEDAPIEEEDDDQSTVYTDIEDDEDTTDSVIGSGVGARGGGGGKKKKTAASKKKASSSKDFAAAASMEVTIQELLITDELKEEPYIE